jgi:hypothetical protein
MLRWITDQVIKSKVRAATAGMAKAFVEWNDIKSLCILISDNRHFNEKALRSFIRDSGKNIETIVFIPEPKAPAPAGFTGFTKKELNFLSLPKSEFTGPLSSKTYDLLIDCNFQDYPSMKLLSGGIKAKFKVGLNGLSYHNYFDICIDLKNDLNLDNYLLQVMNYLKMIKTKN